MSRTSTTTGTPPGRYVCWCCSPFHLGSIVHSVACGQPWPLCAVRGGARDGHSEAGVLGWARGGLLGTQVDRYEQRIVHSEPCTCSDACSWPFAFGSALPQLNLVTSSESSTVVFSYEQP